MGSSFPLHPPGDLTFDGGAASEDECWARLGRRVRGRLADAAGEPIESFAQEHRGDGGRPAAGILGERALAHAVPGLVLRRFPVHRVTVFRFVPGSLEAFGVIHRPAADAPPPPRPDAPPPDLGLDADARGMLGNLPPRAQELLQGPFLDGSPPSSWYWTYRGDEEGLSKFVCYLANDETLTAATGTMAVPPGHVGLTAHWWLTCYRAAVEERTVT
ncbi:hypothetical protein [Actinomadura montaniterrae]|uniref:Uncharacterized protein n=1 Tax=Actinomadura montaniterrae TaxID=1803903 RepID=A0A6L3VMX1_9ACTN|nr:hypothetical protein [Actinomadura montaniterrae]KAB2370362.1 hypothetical protein F9B16_36065 [Actinomadura montaniterrae]